MQKSLLNLFRNLILRSKMPDSLFQQFILGERESKRPTQTIEIEPPIYDTIAQIGGYKRALLICVTFSLLLISFFSRYTFFIRDIDITLAYFFNDIIRLHPSLHNTCAYLNSKMGNWIYDGVIVLFGVPYVFRGGKHRWLKRFIQILLIVAFSSFCFFVFNRYMTRHLHFKSHSPSGVLANFFHLAPLIPWTKVKEFSSVSYPSDHGSTIFMFILTTFYLMGRRIGILSIIASIPFALPRLLVGAHWSSDLFLGSLPLALFNLSWFLYTPIFNTLVNFLLRSIHGLNVLRKKLHKAV